MFYDALTLRAYVLELRERFPLPWFVEKISQVSPSEILFGFRCFLGERPHKFRLLAVLKPSQPSLRWWRGSKPGAVPPSSFVMQLRKHVQGRSILEIQSMYPERALRWRGHQCTLVLELLEREPNLLLLDPQGDILGGYRLGRGGERELRRKRAYLTPPRGDLLDAGGLTAYQLEEIYLADPRAWPQSLLDRTIGLSPEACKRLSSSFDQLESSYRALWPLTLPPSYSAERQKNGRLSIWGRGAPGVSLLSLEVVEEPALPSLDEEKMRLRQRCLKQQQRLRVRLEKLDSDRQKVASAEDLQRQGELLLCYQSQFPRGSTGGTLSDWDGQRQFVIQLDPAVNAAQQAQAWIKRAGKYRRSLPIIEQRVAQTQLELEQLEELLFLLASAESPAELAELRKELETTPRVSGKKTASVAAGPRRYHFGDFALLVGRSPRQNDELVQRSRRDDLWFHVKDSPGAHVVLKTGGQAPDPEVIEAAARCAAHHSSRKHDGKVLVSFTSARRVKKPPGSPAGFVVYSEELTLWVKPGLEGLESGPMGGRDRANR